MEEDDVQLQIKKRARRRLVGAVAFVSVVAVVLPLVMDHEPRPPVQDIEIRIPGQDEKPFAPKFEVAAQPEKPAEKPVEKPARSPADSARGVAPEAPAKPAAKPADTAQPTARVVEVVRDGTAEKPAGKPDKATEKVLDKVAEKPAAKPEKPAEKPVAKPAEKPAEKPASKDDEAKRAAAILAGQGDAKSSEFVVLIGAFSNEANVKNLKTKLSEQGIKTYSEPLDTPQGKKTRVRAGPFATRDAAEKALEKMQRIGVSGVVAAKQ